MPRTADMVFPGGNDDEPVPVRSVRRDMISNMVSSNKVGILDMSRGLMARTMGEKQQLMVGADPDNIIVAWAGDRWTDFFAFAADDEGERAWAAFLSGLTPRRSVHLTEDKLEAIQAYREGRMISVTPAPVKKPRAAAKPRSTKRP